MSDTGKYREGDLIGYHDYPGVVLQEIHPDYYIFVHNSVEPFWTEDSELMPRVIWERDRCMTDAEQKDFKMNFDIG